MSLKIVVLAKQVPDTRNVGKDAMTAEGTINRAALPAIFNPEDLNALEQALKLKETHPGSTVTMLTMGPGRAAEIIREGLYRGADGGYLLTDRAFAGADTLATSYALATAIRKIGGYDLIIGGRQAIDGDTAQVGPQVAEKLGLAQVTYAEEILSVDEEAKKVVIKRHIDGGVETVEAPLPLVITVNGSAAPCRPRNAKLVQKYKRAMGAQEKAAITKEGAELPYAGLYDERPYLNITEWSTADVNVPEYHRMEHGGRECRPRAVRSERLPYQGEDHPEHFFPGKGKQDADRQRPGCGRPDYRTFSKPYDRIES